MSERTKSELDEALARHVADECGDGSLITGYVLNASYTSTSLLDRESTGYYAEYSEGQAFHTSLGLTLLHLRKLEAEIATDEN